MIKTTNNIPDISNREPITEAPYTPPTHEAFQTQGVPFLVMDGPVEIFNSKREV